MEKEIQELRLEITRLKTITDELKEIVSSYSPVLPVLPALEQPSPIIIVQKPIQ